MRIPKDIPNELKRLINAIGNVQAIANIGWTDIIEIHGSLPGMAPE